MKKVFKKSILILLGFIIGSIVCISIGVYAYSYSATDIEYTSGKSVKQAVDDLYTKAGKCPNGFNCSWNPKYFALGTPTTSSTTDYKTLGKQFFGAMDASGGLGLCYTYNNAFYCLSVDNYSFSQTYWENMKSNAQFCPPGSTSYCYFSGSPSVSITYDEGEVLMEEMISQSYYCRAENGSITCGTK